MIPYTGRTSESEHVNMFVYFETRSLTFLHSSSVSVSPYLTTFTIYATCFGFLGSVVHVNIAASSSVRFVSMLSQVGEFFRVLLIIISVRLV
jgi:hypothetical protein